jgi:hypothetical protein
LFHSIHATASVVSAHGVLSVLSITLHSRLCHLRRYYENSCNVSL